MPTIPSPRVRPGPEPRARRPQGHERVARGEADAAHSQVRGFSHGDRVGERFGGEGVRSEIYDIKVGSVPRRIVAENLPDSPTRDMPESVLWTRAQRVSAGAERGGRVIRTGRPFVPVSFWGRVRRPPGRTVARPGTSPTGGGVTSRRTTRLPMTTGRGPNRPLQWRCWPPPPSRDGFRPGCLRAHLARSAVGPRAVGAEPPSGASIGEGSGQGQRSFDAHHCPLHPLPLRERLSRGCGR